MSDSTATEANPNGTASAATRDALLAELETLGADDAPAKPAEKPPAAEPEDKPDVPEPEDETPVADDPDPDPEPEDDAEDDAEPADPETAKRLATLRKQEQRAREAIAAERRQFDRERAEHAEDIKAVREFQELRKRFRYDPLGVSRALGASEDDFEDIARAHYAHSKKGAADPRNKAEVERSLKEREQQERLDALQKRLDERDAAEKQSKAQAEAQREAAKYVESVAKAAGPKAPLAAHFLAKNPERTKAKLGQIAYEMASEMDVVPTPAQVLKAYERIRREELLELGVDADTIVKAKAATPKPGTKPTEKPAATESKPLSKADLLAELEAGKFD